ncbi:MAG: hypothetical protein Q9180_006011 [Flavoplaca navasiana]
MVSGQTTIFSLPREIRDAIYDLVLNSPRTPPSSPQQAGLRYEEIIEKELYRPELASVLYPLPNTSHGPGSALPQVNCQLRQESHDFITNPNLTRSVTYKLDAMLHGPRLWLSWTSVPHSISEIDNIEIDLRILDTLDDRFSSGEAPRLPIVFVLLYRTIDRLLNHGPSFRYHDDTCGLKLDTLTINLLHRYNKLYGPKGQSMKDRGNPKPESVRTSELIHQRVHSYLFPCLGSLVDLGLLSGKVQSLRVAGRDSADVYSTLNFEPPNWLPDELARRGIKWGVDKEMRVKKVNSADLCPGKDEEPD